MSSDARFQLHNFKEVIMSEYAYHSDNFYGFLLDVAFPDRYAKFTDVHLLARKHNKKYIFVPKDSLTCSFENRNRKPDGSDL